MAAMSEPLVIAAYALFLVLLAAATWIDLRQRIIPDVITVPGVAIGLLAVTLVPGMLLPVIWEEPRSFAPPRPVADVLGAFGGLVSEPPPEWLRGRPHGGGLLVPLAIFLAWWWTCTVPFFEPRRGPARLLDPRVLLGVAGAAGIVAVWVGGGVRLTALQSSLIGLAVSASLVWATREGASRALGREAMGFGDVTLMAMIGAWLGWQAAVLVFFLATFIGLAHGLTGLVLHRDHELPYGPSLCLAAVGVVIFWRPLWARAGGFFADPLLLAGMLVGVVVMTAVTLAAWRQWRRP
jgi:prepilin signal peptidase PulO-like enzyme (type II secretory pathway)